MTKSANRANRELIDWVRAGLSLVPDGETLDRVDGDNGLRARLGWVERGTMGVTFETLAFDERYGTIVRRTYELVSGPRLIHVGTEHV